MSRRVDQDWTPDEGDMLAGRLIDVMNVEGTKYGDIPLAVIREDQTGIKFGAWLTPKMLRRLFIEERPAPNSLIIIQYNGLRDTQSGRQFKHFSIRVEHSLEFDGTTWLEAFRAATDKEDIDES